MLLAWLAGSFLAGVWAGTWFSLPALPCAAGALVLAAVAVFRRGPHALPLLLMAAAMLGGARSAQTGSVASGTDPRHYIGRQVQVAGEVAREPDIRDTGANYAISASTVVVDGRTRPFAGTVFLHTSRSVQLEYGDRVVATGRLLSGGAGPNAVRLDFPRVVDQGSGGGGIARSILRLRGYLESNIDAWLPEPEAALLIAITLGARSASLGDISAPLVATGLIHVIAISGIKVALVAGSIYSLSIRWSRRLGLLVGVATLAVYVVLTGATASGERSALMWLLVFVGTFLGRRTVAFVSLSFVAALMVAVSPSLLWDTGFLMSVLGTASIVTLAGPLGAALRRIPSPWREAFSVSLAAQIGTLPVVVLGFHTVSLLGPLANAVVLPLLPVCIGIGFLLGAVGGLAALASPLSAFAYVVIHTVVAASRWLSHLPGVLSAVTLPGIVSVGYYAVFGIAGFWILRRQGWAPRREWTGSGRELTLGLALGLGALTATPMLGRNVNPVSLTWLGSGQSFLLRTHGETVLIDGAPHPFAYLEALGRALPFTVHAIDLAVVTDPRASNVAALAGVLQHYRVRAVLDVGAEYPSSGYAEWRASLRAARVPVYALRTGSSVRLAGALLKAESPDGVCSSPRDCIGLIRIALPGRSFLLTGAASRRELEEAVFRSVALRANVLIEGVPADTPVDFLAAVRPQRVLSEKPAGGVLTLPQAAATVLYQRR